MITLRDYQQKDIDALRLAFKSHNRVLYQLPTGGGKGTIAAYISQNALAKKKRVLFCAHRKKLLNQLEERFIFDKIHGVEFAMMQTLQNNLTLTPPDFLIIDEAHTAAANGYKKILDWAGNIPVLSLTATPERLDGKGLLDVASVMVQGLSIRELINMGHLCDYEIMSLPDNTELNPQEQYADLVKTYQKHAHNEKCVVMCRDMQDAQRVARSYCDAGYAADALYSELSDSEQTRILSDFTKGKLRIVTSVNMLVEGIDIPDISVIQWARRTDSLVIWLQGNGRGLRPAINKKRLLILDHVGNLANHGLPCLKREWRLEGKKAREKAEALTSAYNVRECSACYAAYPSTRHECPYCGAVAKTTDRTIKVLKGELVKIDKDARNHDYIRSLEKNGKEKAVLIQFMKKNPNTAPYAAMMKFCHGKVDLTRLKHFQKMRDELFNKGWK